MNNVLGEKLKELRGKNSIRKVSREAEICDTYLGCLEKGVDGRGNQTKPSPEILRKLANYYNHSYLDLMIKAGYIDYDDLIQWRARVYE